MTEEQNKIICELEFILGFGKLDEKFKNLLELTIKDIREQFEIYTDYANIG